MKWESSKEWWGSEVGVVGVTGSETGVARSEAGVVGE